MNDAYFKKQMGMPLPNMEGKIPLLEVDVKSHEDVIKAYESLLFKGATIAIEFNGKLLIYKKHE